MFNFKIFFESADYIVNLTIWTALYALFALGLNLQWGFTGLINFGHVAFATLGAYTTALLSLSIVPSLSNRLTEAGIAIPVVGVVNTLIVVLIAVTIASAAAAGLGLLIGTSTLRLREDYLAIVTIGISELIRLIANNEEWLTKGTKGVQRYFLAMDIEANRVIQLLAIALLTGLAIFALWQLWRSFRRQWRESQEIKAESGRTRKPIGLIIWGIITTFLMMAVYLNGLVTLSNGYKYRSGLMVLLLLVLAIVYSAIEFLVRSPWGRILKAIREDEQIPRALGKNVFWYKLQAFMLGGAIAGIAGAFLAWQRTTIYPTDFEPLLTFYAWIIVIVGGSGSNAGTLLGAIIYWAYDTLTRFFQPQLKITLEFILHTVYLLPQERGLDDSQMGAFRIMVIGLVLMILMLWRPQGILGKREELTLGR